MITSHARTGERSRKSEQSGMMGINNSRLHRLALELDAVGANSPKSHCVIHTAQQSPCIPLIDEVRNIRNHNKSDSEFVKKSRIRDNLSPWETASKCSIPSRNRSRHRDTARGVRRANQRFELAIRWRRRQIVKWTKPPHWIPLEDAVARSFSLIAPLDAIVCDCTERTARMRFRSFVKGFYHEPISQMEVDQGLTYARKKRKGTDARPST
jgi:hypothetical protein